jgi:hypothetical protein
MRSLTVAPMRAFSVGRFVGAGRGHAHFIFAHANLNESRSRATLCGHGCTIRQASGFRHRCIREHEDL